MAYTKAPKYQQVADALREDIANGVLPPAALLPSEAHLVERFAVSRDTARAAINALKSEGLVTVLHGRGAFVRARSERPAHTHHRAITDTGITAPAGTGARFADTDIDADTWRPVEEPTTYRGEATPELALALGVPEHTPLFIADRLLTDKAGRRLSHRLYLPITTCVDIPALAEDPFRTPGALYTALADGGFPLAFVEQVRAKMPTPDDANTLHIPDGTPMLLTRRVTVVNPGGAANHATDQEIGHGQDGPVRVLAMEETRLSAEDAQLSYLVTPMPQTSSA
ncbi:MAG TPA: GntR family transcriptional regulator [Pseudonocardiaceae bacterium]|jgi:GntR family transcriptional regulator|nr:GntR family transcriptional regulator [Pseudonocardiaceae bacterium]